MRVGRVYPKRAGKAGQGPAPERAPAEARGEGVGGAWCSNTGLQ
jgi:hypothetical protein